MTTQNAAQNVGFRYRKSGTSTWTFVQANETIGTGSGTFTATLESLDPETSYEYKAVMDVVDPATGSYTTIEGNVCSFTTAAQPVIETGYFTDYVMPDLSGMGVSLRTSGSNSDRDDNWYSYNTSSSNRQIAIHTYHPSLDVERLNYVVLYDGSKYAPVWTAHTMNSSLWPNNNVGRNESWTSDPAISLAQQTGLDNAGTVGYSRGHLVASEYRQSTVAQNKQTFYYSNQAPQWQDGFNGSVTGGGNGVWQNLENRVVTMTPSGSTTMLYVVTGVLYEGTAKTLPSGSKNVAIPSHFYKCIMKCTLSSAGVPTSAQGIAFVYTNESHAGANYYDSAFVTSIDAIETRAGFDFFARVPSNLQATAEANTSHAWFTGK